MKKERSPASKPGAQFNIRGMSHVPVSIADRIRIVLVGTQHPGNLGSAARAMRTMGLTRMVLVAPEKPPNLDTAAMAAGAEALVFDAPVFPTLEEAVADCRLVLGCTARSRRIALEELLPREAAVRAVETAAAGADISLVFGRERTGLDNHELQLCHAAVHIPSDPEFSSLNLAAAVQVLAYETRVAILTASEASTSPEPVEPAASHAELEGFFSQLSDTLEAIDFHKGRSPESAERKLRRIFLRADMNAREVRLMRGVLADAQRMARLAGDTDT